MNYKKHRANTFIIDPIDGVDLIYNRYNTDPLTADKDKLDALDKQIDSLQAEVRTYDL